MSETASVPRPHAYARIPAPLPPGVLTPSPDAKRLIHHHVGQRVRWRGRVTAVTSVPPMLCLGAVMDDSGVAIWQSLWLNHTRHLQALGLAENDVLEFVARVDKLLDGSYVLNRPLKMQRVDM